MAWERLTPGKSDGFSLCLYGKINSYLRSIARGSQENGETYASVRRSPFQITSDELDALATKSAAWAKREEQAQALVEALRLFRHADGCFCEAAFAMCDGSHPQHAPECERAQAALAPFEDTDAT